MTAAANFKLLGSCYKNIFDDIFCLSWVHNVESSVLIAEKMGLKLRKFAEILPKAEKEWQNVPKA